MKTKTIEKLKQILSEQEDLQERGKSWDIKARRIGLNIRIIPDLVSFSHMGKYIYRPLVSISYEDAYGFTGSSVDQDYVDERDAEETAEMLCRKVHPALQKLVAKFERDVVKALEKEGISIPKG